MDSPTFLTVISTSTVIFAAVLTAGLTYVFTKRREREADWRKVKLELYRDFIVAIAGIVEGRMTPESEVRYHDAFNTIGLVASPSVLAAVQAFQVEISPANTARTQASHDERYTHMVNAMRHDLAPNAWRKGGAPNFYVISTRPPAGSIVKQPK